MITYFSLPAAQRKTQQIADQFNAAEELWRSLELKRLRRRELCPDLSAEIQIELDLLDFAMDQYSKDCIGFVVEPKEPIVLANVHHFDVSRILETWKLHPVF